MKKNLNFILRENYLDRIFVEYGNKFIPITNEFDHIFVFQTIEIPVNDKIVDKVRLITYYIGKKDGKYAVFHIENPEEPISEWYSKIDVRNSLFPYFIVQESGEAVYKVEGNSVIQITEFYEYVEYSHLIHGKSEYYIAKDKNRKKKAVFHKDNPKQPVSSWWDDILLLEQKYVACDYTSLKAFIFDFYHDNPISERDINIIGGLVMIPDLF